MQRTMLTEERGTHYSLDPRIADVDREMRELSDWEIERLAAQADHSALGSRPWENWTTAERRAIRAANELPRRQRAAKLAAEEAERSQKIEAVNQARINERIATYKSQLRAGFPGDDAAFEQAWPRMLEDWQIREAQQQREAALNAVRARVGSVI